MIDKLKPLKEKYDELCEKAIDPDIIAGNKEWLKIIKERNKLENIAKIYDGMVKCQNDIKGAEDIIKNESDKELKELAQEDLAENKKKYAELCEEAKIELLPKDENDDGNVILELRAGAGGDEAGIFANDLLKMIQYDGHVYVLTILEINK